MTPLFIAIGMLVFLAVVVIVGVFLKTRARGLSEKARLKVLSALETAASQADPVRRVIAVDTVLDLALTELGFSGSLGDKLKKAGPRIPNIQAVWEAHKLRNRLAHEHDATVNQAEVDRAVRILQHTITTLAA